MIKVCDKRGRESNFIFDYKKTRLFSILKGFLGIFFMSRDESRDVPS